MVYFVCGLPGSGKTTWVQQRMGPLDLVYDMDSVAGALTYKVQERENPAARYIANEMYDTFIEYIPGIHSEERNVYIIRTVPDKRSINYIAYEDIPVEVCVLKTKFADRGIKEELLVEMRGRLEELVEYCRNSGIEVFSI